MAKTAEKTLKIYAWDTRMILKEESLGLTAGNPDFFKDFQGKKAPSQELLDEEVEALSSTEVIEKTSTVWPKEDGKPFVWDYQIKGMFKDAIGMLRRVPGSASAELQAHKKAIDGLLFIVPRKIFWVLPEGQEIGDCQRSLRASTSKGERIALSRSETVPVGSSLSFAIKLFKKDLFKVVLECLTYGKWRGFSQWRNSGKGIFDYEILDSREESI